MDSDGRSTLRVNLKTASFSDVKGDGHDKAPQAPASLGSGCKRPLKV